MIRPNKNKKCSFCREVFSAKPWKNGYYPSTCAKCQKKRSWIKNDIFYSPKWNWSPSYSLLSKE